jgi:hypothetical protein
MLDIANSQQGNHLHPGRPALNDETRHQNANCPQPNTLQQYLIQLQSGKVTLTEDRHALSCFSRRIRKPSIMLSYSRGLFEQVSVRTDVAVIVVQRKKGGFT